MSTFKDILTEDFSKALKNMEITTPTDVQAQVIPMINKESDDLIVVAKTGSGKTLAYLCPILLNIDKDIKTPQVVILSPTHELASQIYSVCKSLDKALNLDINPALLIGGANINKQLLKLKEKPKIIIGSAGRLLELTKLKKLKMHTVKTIVLDEGDRLVDKRNIVDTNNLIKTTLRDQRRILYFSASIDNDTKVTLNEIMKTPKEVEVNNTNTIPENIEHYYFECEKRDKVDMIRRIVNGLELNRTMVFVNNPVTINTVSEKLAYHKLKVVSVHGENKKLERKQALDKFKAGSAKIMVTSDLSCRGIDIENVDCVINFDIPEDAKFYQHRAGRTGRAGKGGMCISIATKGEITNLNKMSKIFNIKVHKKVMKYGKMLNISDIETDDMQCD